MKAFFRTSSGRLSFELTGDTMKAVFKDLAAIQDVFDADQTCGCCQSANIRFSVRVTSDESEYYELVCNDCTAKFEFGQHKKGGGLYPKRWDKENNQPLPNRGWKVWRQLGMRKGEANASPRPQTVRTVGMVG